MSKYVYVDRLLDGIDDNLLKFDISEAGEFGEGYAAAMRDVSKLIKLIQIEVTEERSKALELIKSLGLKDELSTIDDVFDEMKHCNL